MVPGAEFWQTCTRMQNASEAGAETSISAPVPGNSPIQSDQSVPPGSHAAVPLPKDPPREIGGPTGPEPTRYGDWEKKGRCIDF